MGAWETKAAKDCCEGRPHTEDGKALPPWSVDGQTKGDFPGVKGRGMVTKAKCRNLGRSTSSP